MHLTGTVMTSSKSVEWLGFELSLQRLRAGMQWVTLENCGLPMGSGETSLMSSFITPDNACAMSGAYIEGGNRLLHVVLWPPHGCHDRCTDRPCSHKQVCKKINGEMPTEWMYEWMDEGVRNTERNESFFSSTGAAVPAVRSVTAGPRTMDEHCVPMRLPSFLWKMRVTTLLTTLWTLL